MYLSKISIKNYRGIRELEVNFDPSINIIIGENGSCKSALIDAIRLLYNIGNPNRDLNASNDDFYENPTTGERANLFEIIYEFKGLTDFQKGAFYEYIVVGENGGEDYIKVSISYTARQNRYPSFNYSTGNVEGQKADYKTFELFQHYYLGALRDSTRDLLNTRNNVLGAVIKRIVERENSGGDIETIMKDANKKLLDRDEVKLTRDNINKNLEGIFKKNPENKIGLLIHRSKVEYIVSAIKPFLPHNKETLDAENGFNLSQNSLGFNNLIYIAVVLGDINERFEDDKVSHFALLIEEPEAHLHPQLQLNLYNFLKETNNSENSQLFITTHSPTLTSKAPFDNLIVLNQKAIRISDCFMMREQEGIIEDVKKTVKLDTDGYNLRKKQLTRYIDVTRSQLFYSRGILMVEGISEELLLNSFTQILGYKLEDYKIELVQIDGVSFYPFLYLFNSNDANKRLENKVSILTDDDRYTKAKEYSFSSLFENNTLVELLENLCNSTESARLKNINSVSNGKESIKVFPAFKTFEFEIAQSNIPDCKSKLFMNLFVKYVESIEPEKYHKIKTYIDALDEDAFTSEEQLKISILFWKALPSKAEFAQNFALHITDNITKAKSTFNIPKYIQDGLKHLIQD